jgi:hypothetical protein
MKKLLSVFLLTTAMFALAGCENAKRSLGLEAEAPDEFAVYSRAPLSMPPDYELRAPDPGAPRPQDEAAAARGADTIFGGTTKSNEAGGQSGVQSFLDKAGTAVADPNIRRTVDKESVGIKVGEPGFVDRLLFWDEDKKPDPIVNPKKEAERVKQAEEEGKPLNEGEVPVIERKRKAPLEGIFN